MARQQRLPGVNWHKGDMPAERSIARGAKEYAVGQGLKYRPGELSGTKADPNVLLEVGKSVAGQQGGGPAHMSPQLHQSYAALHEHVDRQYEHMTTKMGISHEIVADDPYNNPRELRADVSKNRRIRTLATGSTGGTEQMSPEQNDKFRAVHDMFGHVAIGRDFTRHGEEAAAQHHAAMFPPEAHAALFSETRAQNSALIRSGQFPENKGYELPAWATQVKPKLPIQRRPKAPAHPTLF
jgi:hypothetical protein